MAKRQRIARAGTSTEETIADVGTRTDAAASSTSTTTTAAPAASGTATATEEVVPEAATAPQSATQEDEPSGEPVRELRLALVCYGGVSLAIYMHGVTKEIHKLVNASKGLEMSPHENPFDEARSEHVYWEALKELSDAEGVPTRVVVDIIAGTSAGGINGVYLAKALSHNLSQDALRDMWLERGDINKLIPIPVPTIPLKIASWGLGNGARKLFGKPAKPPLDGNRMLAWLWEALNRMDSRKDAPVFPGLSSLVPPDHVLELFVTTTDLSGYTRRVPTYSPKQVTDVWHRHVLEFRYGDGRDQLNERYNATLAFSARATSCFPGAFPPINLANVTEVLRAEGWPGNFARDFARIYGLSAADVESSYFIDGGVLDNFPFRVAIDAIVDKPAASEVDRRLVYIEPDPMVPAPGEASSEGGALSASTPQTVPGMIGTIWAGLSTIPRHEPILSDLLSVREFNERVAEIGDIVKASFDAVEQFLAAHPVPPGGDWEAYDEANRRISEEAARAAGVAHGSYTRLKLQSVIRRFGEVAADVCDFPEDSNHAFFVKDVLRLWAVDQGILEHAREPTDLQAEFLKSFDLEYRERRIRFVIKGLNQLYRTVDERTTPPFRRDLDAAKGALWNLILELRGIVARVPEERDRGDAAGRIHRAVEELFDEERISRILSSPSTDDMDDAVRQFFSESKERLNAIQDELRAYLASELQGFGLRLYTTFRDATEGWEQGVKDRLLVRYLGFPYWDILIYPLQHVSKTAEMNRIEVVRMSPNDVTMLAPRGAKAKLKGVAKGHFGAFFDRKARENDYLWGRLDGSERLLWMLFDRERRPGADRDWDETASRYASRAFRSVLGEERSVLTSIPDVVRDIERQLQATTPQR